MNLRIISFNIHKGIGWKSRKSTFQQLQAEIEVLQPDIILLQEILGKQFDMLATKIWPHCQYGRNLFIKDDHQGNAILSKYPITYIDNVDLSMHKYEHRGLLHTTIQIPELTEPLHLLCVHLGLFPNDRRKQIDKIVEYINTNIPGDLPLILGGDFNDWNSYVSKPLRHELDLHEAFQVLHKSYARTYPAWSPFFKLDRIYSRGLTPVSAKRLLEKSWKNLSDHIGIEVSLELPDHDN